MSCYPKVIIICQNDSRWASKCLQSSSRWKMAWTPFITQVNHIIRAKLWFFPVVLPCGSSLWGWDRNIPGEVNTMAADAMAPCVAMSSAARVSIISNTCNLSSTRKDLKNLHHISVHCLMVNITHRVKRLLDYISDTTVLIMEIYLIKIHSTRQSPNQAAIMLAKVNMSYIAGINHLI